MPTDYRGNYTNMNSPQTSTPTNSNQQSNNTYASKTRTQPVMTFPKRNQAIVINVVENLRLPDYIKAIGNIVQPRNILFASRISNNRVCIYLSTVQHVDNLIENHSTVEIGEYELNIRRLVTPARRLILSNVSPNIPHEILQQALTELKIQAQTPISFLKATFISEEYSHIMSFRRQLYIHPDDNLQLPPSITVDYEETSYRIFLSFDDILCFTCKEKGHITKQCPKQYQETTDTSHAFQSTNNDGLNFTFPSTTELEQPGSQQPEPMDATLSPLPTSPVNNPKKRTATTIDTASIEDLTQSQSDSQTRKDDSGRNDDVFVTPKPTSKPPKKIQKVVSPGTTTPTTMEMMEPARKYHLESNSTITFQTLADFLDNARGTSDLSSLALTYTDNISNLLDSIRNIYPYLTHRTIKNRCTRITKRITRQMNGEDPGDTDSSVSSA